MGPKSVDKHLLELFPKFYFFTPTLFRHRREFEGNYFIFDEPMDAILWMLELHTDDSPDTFFMRSDLENLVCSWYGKQGKSTFNRSYSKLLEHGFLTPRPSASDRRFDEIQMTQRGRALLSQIKQERLLSIEPVRVVIEALPLEQREDFLSILEKIADAAWIDLNSRAKASNLFKQRKKKAAQKAPMGNKNASKRR